MRMIHVIKVTYIWHLP